MRPGPKHAAHIIMQPLITGLGYGKGKHGKREASQHKNLGIRSAKIATDQVQGLPITIERCDLRTWLPQRALAAGSLGPTAILKAWPGRAPTLLPPIRPAARLFPVRPRTHRLRRPIPPLSPMLVPAGAAISPAGIDDDSNESMMDRYSHAPRMQPDILFRCLVGSMAPHFLSAMA